LGRGVAPRHYALRLLRSLTCRCRRLWHRPSTTVRRPKAAAS